MVMKKLLIPAAVAAAVLTAPMAYANPNQGDQCMNWHATTTNNNGNFLVCTHLADSGHIMYWESSIQDRAYRTSGYKTEPDNEWYGFGSGRPCNSNDVTASRSPLVAPPSSVGGRKGVTQFCQ